MNLLFLALFLLNSLCVLMNLYAGFFIDSAHFWWVFINGFFAWLMWYSYKQNL